MSATNENPEVIEIQKRKADSPATIGSDGQKLRDIIRVNDVMKREDKMRSTLERVRITLVGLAGSLQQSEVVKYTGWNVLLVKDGDGWKCVGIVNPDVTKDIPEEFDLCLPIPDPNTVTEFEGW